ncbi:WhiB family transcriptional regulator [Streptomyces globisporus]|uniref:WhiB family transcriptional regulator n=1 Tax=Streptomyces globisporus TaxID=1908 RepID=UPI0037A150F3
MTSTTARHLRRGVLQAAVDAGAVCTGLGLDAFFRADRETDIEWAPRRTTALRTCATCPVRAGCEELALRNGEGEVDADEFVRGGLTGPELADARSAQAVRLAAAVATDQDTEGSTLDARMAERHVLATTSTERVRNGKRVSPAAVQQEQNTRIRALSLQIARTRTARRARAGWGGGGMTNATLPTRQSATGTCPKRSGNFETCSRGIPPGLPRHQPHPAPYTRGGWRGMEEDDNRRGPERDETDQLHQVVRRLTDDGDRRARAAGRHARRTYAEMAPGQTRQPVLRMTRPLTFTPSVSSLGADDACVLCGRWLCGGNCFAPAPTPSLRAVAS